jgi:hypothetical protein
MGWGKLASVCSLKAIALACLLTPTTATILPSTPAYAQFNIIIPGFGGYRYHGRRYGRRSGRHSRRGGQQQGGGEPAGAVSAQSPTASPSSVSGAPAPSTGSGGGKKFRGTADN